jgi:hypothetical protein
LTKSAATISWRKNRSTSPCIWRITKFIYF